MAEQANNDMLHKVVLDNISDHMDMEKEQLRAWKQEQHNTIWGSSGAAAPTGDDKTIKVIGGNVNFGPQGGAPAAADAPTTAAAPVAPPSAAQPVTKKPGGKLKKAALVAATVAGGALAGAAISGAMKKGPIQYEDTNTEVDFGIGYKDPPPQ